ncbi:G-protein coupled receptor family C group 6 member A-like isoform X2 [Polypterus senegalus]|uniref:G-protein coupled receptor family C group 6 member A-like isoform X2 n=1 Tax=Polypterus senegalus TaxID=55291 RepID=UPI00196405AE|nr:G-protein coupled receptor family C group 6 member A-like isoform X2 [Polypterus senegalus]
MFLLSPQKTDLYSASSSVIGNYKTEIPHCQNAWQRYNEFNQLDLMWSLQIFYFARHIYETFNSTCVKDLKKYQNSLFVNTSDDIRKNFCNNIVNFQDVISAGSFYKAYYVEGYGPNNTLICSDEFNLTHPSKCQTTCLPSHKKVRLGSCCVNCYECEKGTFSNGTDCLPLSVVPEVLISILSPAGILLCVGALCVFLKNADTPIVKSSGGKIFYCYLAGHIITFFSSFLFVGQPSDGTCRVGLPLSALGFSLCLSSMLARTCKIMFAFSNTVERPTKFQQHFYILVIVLGTLGEAVICFLWMFLDPLKLIYLPEGQTLTNMVCDCDNKHWYYLCLGYLIVLYLASWGLDIKSQSLPPTFRESRSTFFSMMIFFIILCIMLFIVVANYQAMQAVILGVFIALSSWGILIHFTLPKIFIILCRPQKNNQNWITYITFEYCRHVAFKADLKFEIQQASTSLPDSITSTGE